MEYYLAIKTSEVLILATTRMNLEDKYKSNAIRIQKRREISLQAF